MSGENIQYNLLVPEGTQIVLLREVKAIGFDRLLPKGAVGAVAGLPVDAAHAYRIRFPDGAEAMARRADFSIKKQYQSEIGGLLTPIEEGDLYRFVIFRCVMGSRAFGLDTETSDTDTRGIYLPPAELHWSMTGVPEQIEKKESEEVYWELQKFLILALKANPNILECLYSPLVEEANETARELLAMREIFLSRLVYQTYNGYVVSQFKKLEQDLRARGEIRWKHAMHMIRLLLQGIEILRDGHLTVRVVEHRDLLLAVKRGEIEWDALNERRLGLHRDFEIAFAATRLPERPDYEKANDFLLRARRSMVR